MDDLVIDLKLSPPNGHDNRLTPREIQVLALIAEGKTSKEIAVALGIAFKTVTCHRAHLLDKMGAHNTALLLRAAIRMGLIAA